MASSQFTVEAKGISGVSSLLQKFNTPETFRTLHQRWGIQGMKWVDENFRQQGALTGSPWAALKPSTIAGRRKGKGSGTAQILQDCGRLKESFTMEYSAQAAVIGSALFYSR